jgi:predicted component of type VI protein secretion system
MSRLSIEIIFNDYFSLPIKVIDFDGSGYRLSKSDYSRIGGLEHNNHLGTSFVVGDKVRFMQSSCRLKIGPLNKREFIAMLPGKPLSNAIAKFATSLIPSSMNIALQVVLKKKSVSLMHLGQKHTCLLGLTTWIKSSAFTRNADDMCYEI